MPNLEPGYPGGIFDPLGFSKGNLKELQTKEVKNGRLAVRWLLERAGRAPLLGCLRARAASQPRAAGRLCNVAALLRLSRGTGARVAERRRGKHLACRFLLCHPPPRSIKTRPSPPPCPQMVAFMGFVFAAQTTGKGPLAALADHLSNPGGSNWITNIGTCAVPKSVDVEGLTIPLTCLWPGQQ